VARHAVAEFYSPRETSRRSIGEVGQSSEEAAQPPHRYADGEGADEDRAGRSPDAAHGFVYLDPDDGAGQGAENAVGQGGEG